MGSGTSRMRQASCNRLGMCWQISRRNHLPALLFGCTHCSFDPDAAWIISSRVGISRCNNGINGINTSECDTNSTRHCIHVSIIIISWYGIIKNSTFCYPIILYWCLGVSVYHRGILLQLFKVLNISNWLYKRK